MCELNISDQISLDDSTSCTRTIETEIQILGTGKFLKPQKEQILILSTEEKIKIHTWRNVWTVILMDEEELSI